MPTDNRDIDQGLDGPPRIVVLGSINMDLVLRCRSIPSPGETKLAQASAECCGGKGANQAIAAAKAGGRVDLIGAVGDDAYAEHLIANLRRYGVGCDRVRRMEDQSSGLAVIAVDDQGQNSIIVLSGANAHVTPDWVAHHQDTIAHADCLMIQLEIPIESAMKGIEIARAHSVRVMLDPAPSPTDPPDEMFDVDLICPNESEAAALTGCDLSTDDGRQLAVRRLHDRGVKNVAITLAEEGTLLSEGGDVTRIPSIEIEPVDTTAAGDAYAGALAVRWCQNQDLKDAIRFANVAGALA
ncbi:MAG: ribokinase, partial [Planctomycetota bacterium]